MKAAFQVSNPAELLPHWGAAKAEGARSKEIKDAARSDALSRTAMLLSTIARYPRIISPKTLRFLPADCTLQTAQLLYSTRQSSSRKRFVLSSCSERKSSASVLDAE